MFIKYIETLQKEIRQEQTFNNFNLLIYRNLLKYY